MKKYLMYHLRWQAGIFISWPVLHVLEIIGITSILFKMTVVSFVGACIFWHIDKWIFKGGGMKIDVMSLSDESLKIQPRWKRVLEILTHSGFFIKHGFWWRAMKYAFNGKTYIHNKMKLEPKQEVFVTYRSIFKKDVNFKDKAESDLPRMTPEKMREKFAKDDAGSGNPNEETIYKGEAAGKFGNWLAFDKENVSVKKKAVEKQEMPSLKVLLSELPSTNAPNKKAKPRKRGSKVVNKKKAGPKRKKA